MASQNLFPTIGTIADTTDRLPEQPVLETRTVELDDDRPVQEIDSLCMKCGEQGVTRLLLTSIPYFREVVVMSFRCESCGWSNNEIQSAGAIRPDGTVYTVRALLREDLNRQLVKSSTCTIEIPEFELTIPAGKDLSADQPLRRIENEAAYTKIQTIIDGFREILADNEDEEVESKEPLVQKALEKDTPMKPFTLRLDDPSGNSFIEFLGKGILDQVHEELSEKVFRASDSHTGDNAFENFLKKLKALKNVEQPFTIILDDPLANSYLQNLYAPDPDPNMTIEVYDRTWEQNEELGLNDMKVENYEQDVETPENSVPEAQ
ncbi:hypothetical protein IEO21_07908 [Rhodonia placenta]|uniref:Zinc finger ZPR1-type domain-containing protein n=1 Tax=Rhodonia placenta TaxID=104341 RepID=A0A8H7NXF4_9APHY|nr:hypothetical protein IEO21_07908 [Postia placenta]